MGEANLIEEPLPRRTVETLDETVGLRLADPSGAMCHRIEGHIQRKVMGDLAVELSAIVGEDGKGWDPSLPTEGQHLTERYAISTRGLSIRLTV